MTDAKKVAEVTVEEWAVQYRSNSGGNFDRTISINGRTNKPYTEGQARARVEEFNKGKKPENHCRTAHRFATKWIAV